MRLNARLTRLLASTLLGGNDYDTAYALARTSDGKIIVAGDTYSTNFPVSATAVASASNGSCDVFGRSSIPANAIAFRQSSGQFR